jgi:2-polyprenyl-3-methyl-5-hydroxy-6-metoxy-1,4-benzoquinol methylase
MMEHSCPLNTRKHYLLTEALSLGCSVDRSSKEGTLDVEEITKKKREVVARFGPWTAHCIHLGHHIYTFDKPQMEPQEDSRLRRFLQIVSDVVEEPLDRLRVLDLACLEGHFAIEFALHGANVLAIEGREANLEKTRFVKEVHSLSNIELVLDDVRNLDEKRHGYFDVVLCLGILYHLNTPDVIDFLERISKVCARMTIIDTHISDRDEASYTWKGKTYWGRYAYEHDTNATPEEKSAKLWKSLDNPRSFHFTRASLCNVLRHVGFTSVYACLNPYEYHNPNWPSAAAEGDKPAVWKNRITLVAIKGRNQTILSSPVTETSPEIDRPEKPIFLEHGLDYGLKSRLGKFLPGRTKKLLEKIIR